MSKLNLKNDLYNRKKEKYIKEATNELSVKSFYDKHIKTILFSNIFATYVFSPISVLFGCIAVYSTALNTIGLNVSLLDSLKNNGSLPYLLIILSILFLAFFELGKHHFYNQGFTEYYRKTDDFGSLEFIFATTLQIFSILLSFYGGYLAANEIAGTQKTQVLSSINAEYLPLIEQAKTDKIEFKNAKLWRGKISDKHTPELNRLQSEVDNIQTQYLNAKIEAGVGDGFVKATQVGTKKMIFILGGSQIAIELFLTFCLWWVVFFKSKVVHESNVDTKDSFSSLSDSVLDDVMIPDLLPVMEQKKQIGYKTYDDTHTPTHTPTYEATKKHKSDVPIVTQPPQVEIIDLDAQKKRVRAYVPRINKRYTQNLFDTLQDDIEVLASNGYKVTLKNAKKVSILKSLPYRSKVNVSYDGKLNINYV